LSIIFRYVLFDTDSEYTRESQAASLNVVDISFTRYHIALPTLASGHATPSNTPHSFIGSVLRTNRSPCMTMTKSWSCRLLYMIQTVPMQNRDTLFCNILIFDQQKMLCYARIAMAANYTYCPATTQQRYESLNNSLLVIR